MALTVITDHNIEAFRSILPQGTISGKAKLFGWVEADVACASAVLEEMNEEYSLVWLWVAPAYRRRGIGGALLDAVCRFAVQSGGNWLSIDYSAEEEWSRILSYLLLLRGFRLERVVLPQYRLHMEALGDVWFMKQMENGQESQSIIPLQRLDVQQLKRIMERLEYQKKYLVSRADFGAADGECSMVLLKEGELKGVTLIRKTDAEGLMCLELFYLDPKYITSGMALLRQTIQAILRQPEELREIQFTCISDSSLQLAQRLLGDTGREDRRIFSGVLELEFYQRRGKADV